MKRIAVCSGGALKGYSQIQVLKKIENDVKKPLCEYYDLFVGTSVGSINAAFFASGKLTANYIESIYKSMALQIFKKSWFPFTIPIYNRKNFLEIAVKEIGMIKMKECKTKLQITAVNLCDKRNHFFKSWEDKDGEDFLWSNVCKSFAAPLYFDSFVDENNKMVFIDGGMGFANFPVSNALTEAMCLWPDEEYYFDLFGCGFVNENISFEKAKSFKFVRQLGQFFDIGSAGLARAQSRVEEVGAIQQLAKFNPKIHFNYWDIEIEKKYDKFDGVEFLDYYKTIGIEMAEKPLITS